MPGLLTRWSPVGVALAAVGCGPGRAPKPPGPSTANVVSVGMPIAPRRVDVPPRGSTELRARNPGPGDGPRWFLAFVFPPRAHPSDVCLATGLVDQGMGEADTSCDVGVSGSATSFIADPGIPSRYGPGPTVISGVAPPEVRAVQLKGPGGTRTLPLSAHRAFLALYAGGTRGRVRLISELGHGERARSFELPLAARFELSAHHQHRRRGAVFNDEVGENITSRSYRQVTRRFGAPAAVRRHHSSRCAYYELVGSAHDGWRFCFARDGHMIDATGNSPPPPH